MPRLSAIWVGALAISLFEVQFSGAQQSSPQPPTTAPALPELPDAPSVYVPLSGHDKFKLFLRRTYSPYTFVTAAAEATWAQMWAQWPDYGGGMPGWGKRFGATLADTLDIAPAPGGDREAWRAMPGAVAFAGGLAVGVVTARDRFAVARLDHHLGHLRSGRSLAALLEAGPLVDVR